MAELRQITSEELTDILEQHRKWVESGGTDGKIANLSQTNLSKANLEHRNLQEAALNGANLQEANLTGINLRQAALTEADLRKSHLVEADLQGADLLRAKLQGANLAYAQLRESNLQNAILSDVTGLLAGQLAGANVSGATLPQDIHKFEALTTIDEASKNTKRIFLAMLLACAYSALTVFSTTDARLLTNSASSPLPIIGTAIPIAGFFGVAPVILFAIFIYFHLYLQRLWEGLADLPAIFSDGRPLDKCAYPWLLNGLVRSHFAILRRERPPLSRFQALITIVLAWWTVPFTIVLFWLRYLPRHDWIGTGFHLAFLIVTVVCAFWFQRLAKTTLRGQQSEPIVFKGNWRRVKPYWETVKRKWKLIGTGATIMLFAFVISDGAINGIDPKIGQVKIVNPAGQDSKFLWIREPYWIIIPKILPYIGAHAFANFTEKDVSSRPPNWFRDGELPRLVKGAQLNGANLQYVRAQGAFLVNADLRFGKLRGANLEDVKLQGANLYYADLQGANLLGVNLKEASLIYANLQEANLAEANLQGANLNGADLKGARFGDDIFVGDYEIKGLTVSNVTGAKNWDLAFYPIDFLGVLGLPPDHNKTLKKKLAEIEKKEKEAATKK